MKEGRKPEHPEKTPGDELQKMPHTTARRFKPQARLEPWWQARKADMPTVTPRVAPDGGDPFCHESIQRECKSIKYNNRCLFSRKRHDLNL